MAPGQFGDGARSDATGSGRRTPALRRRWSPARAPGRAAKSSRDRAGPAAWAAHPGTADRAARRRTCIGGIGRQQIDPAHHAQHPGRVAGDAQHVVGLCRRRRGLHQDGGIHAGLGHQRPQVGGAQRRDGWDCPASASHNRRAPGPRNADGHQRSCGNWARRRGSDFRRANPATAPRESCDDTAPRSVPRAAANPGRGSRWRPADAPAEIAAPPPPAAHRGARTPLRCGAPCRSHLRARVHNCNRAARRFWCPPPGCRNCRARRSRWRCPPPRKRGNRSSSGVCSSKV